MAFVLLDNEYFKFTLQIIEDFIGEDYDAFIENGPLENNKLIKWELVIYFKTLENKKKTIVEYYMIAIYERIKTGLYWESPDGYFSYYGHIYRGRSDLHVNTLSIDLKKNILAKTITIKFICDETYKTNYCGFCITDIKTYTYLNNIQRIICQITSYQSSPYEKGNVLDYCKTNGCICTEKYITPPSGEVNWLKDIVKNHYNNILINFDSYILYCKTNKSKINLKKITERTNYIKEYVKKVYDITLV